VYQSKIKAATEEAKLAYVELSVCIFNTKSKIVDLAGVPYGSFFLRNGNVSGIQNGRIGALGSQMYINRQELRCARFRADELKAVYLFSMGAVVKSSDAATAAKVHANVGQMLEGVMKRTYEEQYNTMLVKLGELVGPNEVLPVLVGISTS
jgi:hypothetical protein